jgi:hypothetical protein
MKKNVRNEEMKGILSDYVKMKFETIDDLLSKGDFKGLEEFYKSEEFNKFETIQDIYGMEDENGNECVMFFDDSVHFKECFVYTVNVKTLEDNILLIEDDFKKAERFFYGFKYSDKFFEIEDNLDEGESLMSQKEDGVWVNYILKIENNELVSTIELNKYRLNKGLKPIDYNPLEDSYKRA